MTKEPRPPSLTDGHQEVLQVPRHLALDALLQRLLADVLVLDQSCQRHVGEVRFFFFLRRGILLVRLTYLYRPLVADWSTAY